MKIDKHGTPIPSNRIVDPMLGDTDDLIRDIPDYWDSVLHNRSQERPSECITRIASPEEIEAELRKLGIK